MLAALASVLLLITISFTTIVSSNSTTEKKDSPLFEIRTRRAIGKKIGDILDNINFNLLESRIFFQISSPLQRRSNSDNLYPRWKVVCKLTVAPKTTCP
jgi:hypothetical protein